MAFIGPAHKKAYKAGYMHRDISAGNILIYTTEDESGNVVTIGLLADWELCKHVDDRGEGPRQPDRTVGCPLRRIQGVPLKFSPGYLAVHVGEDSRRCREGDRDFGRTGVDPSRLDLRVVQVPPEQL